jgi:hypothetical protein
MRNCLWLQSPNICKVRESDDLKEKKEAFKLREKERKTKSPT